MSNATYEIIRDGETKTFNDESAWKDMQQLLDENDVEYETTSPNQTSADGGTVTDSFDEDADVVDHSERQQVGINSDEMDAEDTQETQDAEDTQSAADNPATDAQVVESVENEPVPANTDDPLSELGEELGTDPLEILPNHMKDTIKGTPAVNKRGYAMIAERYGIEASAEIEVFPWENDENRCVARAEATTEDGKSYSGWATAAAGDGDMQDQIIELAETRALKRCVSWASGVGIVSYQELADELEGQ